MSAAPDGDPHQRRMPGRRARLVLILVVVLIALVILGYLILVGGTVGDEG